jgi:hypothetical protein
MAHPATAPVRKAIEAEQRFVLRDVPWEDYETLYRIFEGRPGLRMTYDRGTLELMTTLHEHERFKELFDTLIEHLCLVLRRPFVNGGSQTFKRAQKVQGLEPD